MDSGTILLSNQSFKTYIKEKEQVRHARARQLYPIKSNNDVQEDTIALYSREIDAPPPTTHHPK